MPSVVRWVKAANIHLTLKFLGDVPASNLDMVTKMLSLEVGQHPPFEISIGKLGVFPSIQKPRVIWIGIEAPQVLSALQRGIDLELAALGYPPDERPFSPHLTLGRVARNAQVEDLKEIGVTVKGNPVGFLGTIRVLEVDLYQSDLTPNGSIYTRLFSTALGSIKE